MKNRQQRWTTNQWHISWFRAPDKFFSDLSKVEIALYKNAPLSFWCTHIPGKEYSRINKTTANNFLDGLNILANQKPLNHLPVDALNFFIESVFFWLFGKTSLTDSGIKLIYKKDANFWKRLYTDMVYVSSRCREIAPIFFYLPSPIDVWKEKIATSAKELGKAFKNAKTRSEFSDIEKKLAELEQKTTKLAKYNSLDLAIGCIEANSWLDLIAESIKKFKLDTPNAELPIHNLSNFIKTRRTRRGRSSDYRLAHTIVLWVEVLKNTTGKQNYEFISTLLNPLPNYNLTPDTIHRNYLNSSK